MSVVICDIDILQLLTKLMKNLKTFKVMTSTLLLGNCDLVVPC
jgi:hypothetical protein